MLYVDIFLDAMLVGNNQIEFASPKASNSTSLILHTMNVSSWAKVLLWLLNATIQYFSSFICFMIKYVAIHF